MLTGTPALKNFAKPYGGMLVLLAACTGSPRSSGEGKTSPEHTPDESESAKAAGRPPAGPVGSLYAADAQASCNYEGTSMSEADFEEIHANLIAIWSAPLQVSVDKQTISGNLTIAPTSFRQENSDDPSRCPPQIAFTGRFDGLSLSVHFDGTIRFESQVDMRIALPADTLGYDDLEVWISGSLDHGLDHGRVLRRVDRGLQHVGNVRSLPRGERE